jgi:hypothetical protein
LALVIPNGLEQFDAGITHSWSLRSIPPSQRFTDVPPIPADEPYKKVVCGLPVGAGFLLAEVGSEPWEYDGFALACECAMQPGNQAAPFSLPRKSRIIRLELSISWPRFDEYQFHSSASLAPFEFRIGVSSCRKQLSSCRGVPWGCMEAFFDGA